MEIIKQNENIYRKLNTTQHIQAIKARIADLTNGITNAQAEISELNNEIEQLNNLGIDTSKINLQP